MTLTIELPAEVQRKLADRAARVGRTAEAVATELIARGVNGGPTLEEILAPIRARFKQSGMTDDSLADLVEEVREEIWQEKQSAKQP